MAGNPFLYLIGIAGGLFLIIVIAYILVKNKTSKDEAQRIRRLREGTKEKYFSMEILYQKLYIFYKKIPLAKRYLLKIRRKLEIIHIDDEYKTRMEAAKIITKGIVAVVLLTIVIVVLSKDNPLILAFLLLFEMFLIESIMSGMVDKLDTKLLKQQIEFFADIRHAYHEFNMVEEAIYEVSQRNEQEVSRQGEKIHEILISDDPETELEKYYDIAPNSYLKEFAGVSYLTKEFGDRTIDGASLYLKNLNNITEEMQLEILKRDRLDYVFQSLSIISIVPILLLQPLKNWAVSNFSFTTQFYNGKGALIVQILLVILTYASYILIRKIKDTGSIKEEYVNPDKVWQMKLYKKELIKPIVDLFIPKPKTKEYRKITKNMKEAAYKQKIETLYVNKLVSCIAVFFISIGIFNIIHNSAINYVYNEPTATYDLIGGGSEEENEKGMILTKQDNETIRKLKGNPKIKEEDIIKELKRSKYYIESTDMEIETAASRIYKKLQIINSENFQWFELLLAFAFAWVGYLLPTLMLILQKILRKLEMENEVMQFQTIILMLMKIERVNVEIILEWIERYSNIFKEPITKCVNNYEAGAWEALEALKNEIAFPQLIQIVESLQAAVEKIPIVEAFDELDNEREYYQEKRKEANARLIQRKGMIGKIVGFAPMVCVFVGYLIIPLMIVGLGSITDSFSSISSM